MSEPQNGTLAWRVTRLEDGLKRLQDLEPAVLANEVKNLRDEVRGLKRALVAFGFGVVGSAVVFALSVFALLGR